MKRFEKGDIVKLHIKNRKALSMLFLHEYIENDGIFEIYSDINDETYKGLFRVKSKITTSGFWLCSPSIIAEKYNKPIFNITIPDEVF